MRSSEAAAAATQNDESDANGITELDRSLLSCLFVPINKNVLDSSRRAELPTQRQLDTGSGSNVPLFQGDEDGDNAVGLCSSRDRHPSLEYSVKPDESRGPLEIGF